MYYVYDMHVVFNSEYNMSVFRVTIFSIIRVVLVVSAAYLNRAGFISIDSSSSSSSSVGRAFFRLGVAVTVCMQSARTNQK